jgi:hypothetical protein
MTEDQNVLKAPDTANIREEPGTASKTPYYWSWYRLVFSCQGPQTGPTPDDPHVEKH